MTEESDYENYYRSNTMKKYSDKYFGLIFSLIFLIISIFPFFYNNPIRIWSLILSFLLLLIAFIYPKLLSKFNNLWSKFAYIIARIIDHILLFLAYVFAILIIGILLKLLKKDPLLKSYNKNINSYWIKKEDSEKYKVILEDQY